MITQSFYSYFDYQRATGDNEFTPEGFDLITSFLADMDMDWDISEKGVLSSTFTEYESLWEAAEENLDRNTLRSLQDIDEDELDDAIIEAFDNNDVSYLRGEDCIIVYY